MVAMWDCKEKKKNKNFTIISQGVKTPQEIWLLSLITAALLRQPVLPVEHRDANHHTSISHRCFHWRYLNHPLKYYLLQASQVVQVVKNPPANAGDVRCGFDPRAGNTPWRKAWQPTPVFLPGESHGQGSLRAYSTWDRKKWDTTELNKHAYVICCIGFLLVL